MKWSGRPGPTRFGLFAFAVAVCLAASGCFGGSASEPEPLSSPPGDLDSLSADLDSLPEYGLATPRSVQVGCGSRPRTRTLTEWVPAQAGCGWRTDETTDEVRIFFAAELSARGWIAVTSSLGIRGTTELFASAWGKDGVTLRLSADDPRAHPALFEGYATVYTVMLLASAANEP